MPERIPRQKQAVWADLLYRCKPVLFWLRSLLCKVQLFFLEFYKHPDDAAFLTTVYRSRRCMIQPFEAYALLKLARMQSELEGDMAEIGVYEGASAHIICHAKGQRHFFGFDTFEGLPEDGEAHEYRHIAFYRKGMFVADFERARSVLHPFANVTLVKGVFPASALSLDALRGRMFSFVHIDADLYTSTKDGLAFFWERMVPGGMIIVHDSNAQGIVRALRGFIDTHHPKHFDLYASQTVFIK